MGDSAWERRRAARHYQIQELLAELAVAHGVKVQDVVRELLTLLTLRVAEVEDRVGGDQ